MRLAANGQEKSDGDRGQNKEDWKKSKAEKIFSKIEVAAPGFINFIFDAGIFESRNRQDLEEARITAK